MPELPEVETVRRTLAQRLVGQAFAGVTVRRRDVIASEQDPIGGFGRARGAGRPTPARLPKASLLVGDRVDRVIRHGKQLALVGASGRALGAHLGMSGRLLVVEAGARAPQAAWRSAHDHVVWRLEGGGRLLFRDPRRFGGLWTSPSEVDLRARRWDALGPDALTISGATLAARAGRSSRVIKGALLDQRVLAGVGNIYADESLFLARLHPLRRAETLGTEAWERLAGAIREVLREAIDAGGSTLRDYTDANGTPGSYARQHAVYGRGGQACRVCGHRLEAGVVAQRMTVWCPSCQAEHR